MRKIVYFELKIKTKYKTVYLTYFKYYTNNISLYSSFVY